VKKIGKNNLAQENERLRKENAHLFAENERLRQEVKFLNEKIDWLMKKMFGSSSEALELQSAGFVCRSSRNASARA